jgi:hypothetical protein
MWTTKPATRADAPAAPSPTGALPTGNSQPPKPASPPPTPSAADNPNPKPAASSDDGPDLFSDAMGGFWAGVTTAFCVLVGGGAHLVLLAADLGSSKDGSINWGLVATLCTVAPAVLAGVATWALAAWRNSSRPDEEKWASYLLGLAAAAAAALVAGILCVVAWMSSSGRQVAWEPVVGSSLTMVALASFGGYFLASRRARVGLASSFVLTFLLLFSFMLTLRALSTTTSGSQSADLLSGFVTDFRGHVALIVAFYFGTDAAVSAAKILKTPASEGSAEISRLDRDLAVPRSTKSPTA